VLYDTLWITDTHTYDTADGNAWSGGCVFNTIYQQPLHDDFEMQQAKYPNGVLLNRVTQDSLSFFSRMPVDGAYVRIYATEFPHPYNQAFYENQLDKSKLTLTRFDDYLFGLVGVRIAVDVSQGGYKLPVGDSGWGFSRFI
jgi:hypothetical protein